MKRRLMWEVLALAWLVAGVSTASAYDRRTHAITTERAFDASSSLRQYLRAAGLTDAQVFDPTSRTPPDRLSNFVNAGTARGWAVEGAIREDDYKTNLSLFGCAPPTNPPSAIDRLRHHFFDPEDGRGLHLGPVTLGLPAPAWALGEQGRGAGPEDNQFSVLDARTYQLRSLTEASAEDRERYTALLFRSLGQVAHLIEDMAQPQHVRNDIHPACENALSGAVIPEHSWYEEYIETRALGLLFRGRPVRPLMIGSYPPPSLPEFLSYFTHTDRRRGLADFTSRNFLTAGTNLGSLPPCAGRSEPPCHAEGYSAIDVPHSVVTAGGLRLEAPVRLLRRTLQDPITLASIPDVALTSRSLWDQHLEARGLLPSYSMNVLTYDAISDVLLPRAAGYVAGFLDHFFAGQLAASVQPAGETDPTILKLVARNASQEAVDGVLLIYAEDVSTGERQSVLSPTDPLRPLGAVASGVVLADGLFPEIAFRPPFPAEKYVVVYHGKRLGPRLEDPPPGAVGSVMAQVLGGPRVEAIVSQDERRLLRSVAGAFDLPPASAGLELIQWSDIDNHFVGITGAPLVTGQAAPDEIKLFRIERPLRSVEVPLVADTDPPMVDATLVKTVAFPYGLELPAVVDYVQRVQVRQPLVTYERAVTLVWSEDDAEYGIAVDVVGPPSLEIPVDETVTFAERFPVVLDGDHLFGATLSTPRPYTWRVLEVGQDVRERLLAVVEVRYTRPLDADRRVVLKSRTEDCSAFEPRGAHDVTAQFQASGLIAIIDLERGTVLGTTGTPLFAPSSTELAAVPLSVQVRQVATLVGGPRPGILTQCLDTFLPEGNSDLPTEVAGTVTLPPTGPKEFAVPGLYSADIEAVAGTSVWIASASNEFEIVYATTSEANKALTLVSPSSRLVGYLTLVREGVRMRPGSRLSTEVALRFDRPEGIGEVASVLVRWDPEFPLGTRLAVPGELEPGVYRLTHATPDAALLRVEDVFSGSVGTVLADFTTGALRSFEEDLTSAFVLLPPSGLYNLTSTHFHTLDTLAETALPAALAPGPAAGAYHLIVRD